MSSRHSPPPVRPISTAPPPRGRKGEAAPSPTAGSDPTIDRESALVELRLAIGKDGLGIELGRDAHLGCVEVTELVVSLPGVRFPLDVSGGVSRFRHRRGEMRRLAIELSARAVEKWAAPKLRGLISATSPEVWIGVRRGAATIGLASKESAAVLAFDVTFDTHEEALRFSIVHARGSGLVAPASELALLAMKAVIGKLAGREGSRFTIDDAVFRIARSLLPEAGARAPSSQGMRWSATSAHDDKWILHASFEALQADADEEAARAREANALTRDADDARAAGDRHRARALDVASLERAPRHPEIASRIAEIDQLSGGRAEAALATLTEADRDPRAPAGTLAAELLVEVGDLDAAIAAFARVGESEPVPALAARAYERAAELVPDPFDALVWLDQAVVRAPWIARIRWARLGRRLAAGRLEDALADVEHLEAMTSGGKAKHAVWRRAGVAWRTAGLAADATTLFERALRYVPEDPEALAGLGASLVATRKGARGVALLARAVELAEEQAIDANAMILDLARALAEAMHDRPAAIARVRSIPAIADEAIDARALEGRWRASLGDHAGASLAFAQLRDAAASNVENHAAGAAPDRGKAHGRTDRAVRAAAYLREAAKFETESRADPLAAQRHLATALRLRPHDADLAREYRAACAAVAPAPAPTRLVVAARPQAPADDYPDDLDDDAIESTYAEPIESARAPSPRVDRTFDLAFASEEPPSLDEARDANRVDELTRTLQNDPTRDDVVDELAALLVRLGRSMELLALLSARLEEAPADRRAQLLPAQRSVLERLEIDARAAGREMEASLFRDARLMLD